MKLNKLVDPAFQTALRKLTTQEVPLKSAFKLKSIIKQVNDALTKYDEVRTEALKRFGEKDSDGNLIVDDNKSVKLSEDSAQAFIKELSELLADEVQVDTLNVADLGDKLSMTTSELMLLEDVILG